MIYSGAESRPQEERWGFCDQGHCQENELQAEGLPGSEQQVAVPATNLLPWSRPVKHPVVTGMVIDIGQALNIRPRQGLCFHGETRGALSFSCALTLSTVGSRAEHRGACEDFIFHCQNGLKENGNSYSGLKHKVLKSS